MSHHCDLVGVTVMTVRHMMSTLSDAGAKRVKAVHNMQLCSNHLYTLVSPLLVQHVCGDQTANSLT